jgi:hypothetical protein
MASFVSVQSFVEGLIQGLKERGISFVISRGTLGCQLSEIFIEEARELILIPEGVLSQDSIRWILEIRTPIGIRLTIFTNEVTEYRLRVMRAVSDLKEDGVLIPNVEDAISIQELSNRDLVRLLESLENWHDLKTSGRPLPRENCASRTAITTRSFAKAASEQGDPPPCLENGVLIRSDASPETHSDLHMQLRNAIKTYWTERYLTRFLSLSVEKAREMAQRIGIGREVCGQEILYFFDRPKALRAYFVHLLKGVLEELGLRYEEELDRAFFLPEFSLAVVFFDGNKEQLQILAEDYARSYDLIFVVPEQMRITIGRIQDDLFRVIPLTRNHIASALRGLAQQGALHHKPATQTYQHDIQ